MKSKNIITAGIALLTFTLSGNTLFAAAEEKKDTVILNKTAKYDYATQRGEITLESYVPGEIKVVQKARPLDLVMVLDNSSSMDWNREGSPSGTRRWETLVQAMNQFIDKMYDNAVKNNVDHKLSIVIFGGNGYAPTYNGGSTSSTKIDYITPTNANFLHEVSFGSGTAKNDDCKYSCVIKRFNSIKTEKDNLKATLADFDPNGANTATSRGFLLAKLMYENFARSKDDAVRTIVFFSDGEPQSYSAADKFWGEQNGPSSYIKGNVLEANAALDYANAMKADGVTIFSVYYNHNQNTDILTFMEALSSNYMTAKANCDANGMKKSPAWNLGTSYKPKDFSYYINASNGTDDLINAFNTIAGQIEVIVNEKYDVYTTMNDFINNTYFQYPNDATVEDIHVYENKLAAYDKDNKKYTFSEAPEDTREITSEVTVKLIRGSETGGNDQVKVYGYNYSANWCGIDQSTNTVHGNRVLVKLPFIFKGGNDVATVPTNTKDSGLTPVMKDEKGNPVVNPDTGEPVPDPDPTQSSKYNVPEITFCTMTISRENLHRGETAIYRVVQKNEDGSETFIANVPIGGVEESTTVSKSLYGLPGKVGLKFTAEETNWNWAYDKSTTSEIKKEAEVKEESGRYYVDFLFSGKHIELNPDDPNKAASMKSHDEDFVENYINLDTLPKASE